MNMKLLISEKAFSVVYADNPKAMALLHYKVP